MPIVPEAAERVLRALYEFKVHDSDVTDGTLHLTGHALATFANLAPPEINDGIDLLEARGLVRSLRGAGHGVAPYKFAVAFLTAEGRAEYRQLKREEHLDPRTVFVIHGRDTKARDSMFEFLRAIGLDPLEWEEIIHLADEASPHVWDALEAGFKKASAVVALFTGDDIGQLRPELGGTEPPSPQARQNVILETGMAMAYYKQRVVLARVGELGELPSDLAGRHWIVVDNEGKWRQRLADRLRRAGCAVKTEGREDWTKAGAELQGSGAKAVVPLQQSTPVPAEQLGTLEEQALLFRVSVEERCRVAKFTLKLRDERSGTAWAGLHEEQLVAVLRTMAQERKIEIVSEAGTIFVIKKPPARLTRSARRW